MRTPGQDDAKQYQVVRDAMNTVGFGEDDQEEIFQIIAAILHLGQIDFKHEGNYAKVLSHDIVKIVAQVGYLYLFFGIGVHVTASSVKMYTEPYIFRVAIVMKIICDQAELHKNRP